MGILDSSIVTQANANFNGLKDNFVVPSVDLSGYNVPDFVTNPVVEPEEITIDSLTDTFVDGSGAFDKLMTSVSNHLQNQVDEGNLEKDQFAKVYSEVMIQAMNIAVQFVLGKATSNYQNQLIKKQIEQQEIQNQTTKIQLEISKLNASIAVFNAENASAQFALTKQQLAVSNADYFIKAQQIETERAKTVDTLSDGTTAVAGIVGKEKLLKDAQINLYTEQSASYVTDREVKVAKIISESYTINKSQDPGLEAPSNFTNAEIDEVLNILRSNNNLGTAA